MTIFQGHSGNQWKLTVECFKNSHPLKFKLSVCVKHMDWMIQYNTSFAQVFVWTIPFGHPFGTLPNGVSSSKHTPDISPDLAETWKFKLSISVRHMDWMIQYNTSFAQVFVWTIPFGQHPFGTLPSGVSSSKPTPDISPDLAEAKSLFFFRHCLSEMFA